MIDFFLVGHILGDGKDYSYSKLNETTTKMKVSEKRDDLDSTQLCHPISSGSANSIHRIQEVPLSDISLDKVYSVQKLLAEGCFARIMLANHRNTESIVVLKAVHAELTTQKDFYREFHYSYHLSPHPNILDSYNVSFKSDNYFVFATEYAPYGDLSAHIKIGGLPETTCKGIAQQLASALDFMHSKALVHRDLKLENVLVFAPDASKVKLCDFGATRKEGSLVSKLRCTWLPFLPPEIYEIIKNERYLCKTSSDCWQLGIIIFVCLTGCPPWQTADSIQDSNYASYWRYQKRRTTKIPAQFRRFSPRLLRMFRRLFEHKFEKRAPVTEINKYLKDSWFESKIMTSQSCSQIISTSSLVQERKDSLKIHLSNDGSRHSQENNKNRVNKLISTYGLETSIDQKMITKRVWEWVLSCETDADHVEGI